MSMLDDEIAIRDLLAPLAAIEPARRRLPSRHRRAPLVAVVALAMAGAVAVAAMAATSTWIFGDRGAGEVFGSQQVSFHGGTYTLDADGVADGRWFSLVLVRGDQPAALVRPEARVATASGGSILAAPGVKDLPLVPHPKPTGPAFGAINYDSGGGEIWFGDARPSVSRIEITDNRGQIFRVATSVPPPTIKLAVRFWVIALPRSTAATIAGYDRRGKLIETRPIWGLVSALYLH